MVTARRDKEWFRCEKCGHKLGRAVEEQSDSKRIVAIVEIKCHSCKTINRLEIDFGPEI